MTIDMMSFEMTLEVLGEGEDACEFFRTYDAETRKDLESMRQYINASDWMGLKRICHTWKGRASQIGFRKSSFIAASLHDFIQHTCNSNGVSEISCSTYAPTTSNCTTSNSITPTSFFTKDEMVSRQVEIFFETLRKECETIDSFLKSQRLL